jgi:cell wall-associated NlpC family hydrolase
MPFNVRRGILVLIVVGFLSVCASAAQRNVAQDDGSDKGSLLSKNEGKAVIAVALSARHNANSRRDCSHLVHAIFEQAGFPYPYANSASIYSGVSEFRQVGRPRPGDLVVWPGHVGIVLNPRQHSFFSALRSGADVDSYNAPYWKERGRARFYRYVKLAGGNARATDHRASRLKAATLERH